MPEQRTTLQMPLFAVKSDWRPPVMADLPSWRGAKRVGFDVETKDPTLKDLGPGVRRGGQIVGLSYAIEDGPGGYLPIRHFGGGNLPVEQVLQYFRDQAKYFDGELVGAHLAYDLDYSAEEQIEFKKVSWFRDVLILDPLIYELHLKYSLEEVSKRWGLAGKDETILREAARGHGIDPKGEMWKLHSKYVGVYGETDTRRPLEVLRLQEERAGRLGLQKVWDLESALLPVLVRMRRRGVKVNLGKVEEIEEWAIAQERAACQEIYRLSGRRLGLSDVKKPKILAPILNSIGVTLTKGAGGLDSIDKGVLADIDHPIARAVELARKMSTLRSNFCSSVRKFETNGRIHGTLNQVRTQTFDESGSKGAAFGRCSHENPNLANQPSRDDFAATWRAIYEPEDGCMWASEDFSSQEPRMAVHLAVAAGPGLIGSAAWDSAKEMADRYWKDPSTDIYRAMMEISGADPEKEKPKYKIIVLGRTYGMGEAKLCDSLGYSTVSAIFDKETYKKVYSDVDPVKFDELSRKGASFVFRAAGPEGREFINRFDETAPYLFRLAKACEKRAKEKGEIRTLYRRICHFPQRTPGHYDWTHKALNRAAQGSAGDQTKQAMIDLDAAGFFVQLQIHDEITLSCETEDQAREAGRIMENSVELNVPSKVSVKIGANWGAVK